MHDTPVFHKRSILQRSILQLATGKVFPYPEAMEVHLTPEQQAQLAQIATDTGTDAERLEPVINFG